LQVPLPTPPGQTQLVSDPGKKHWPEPRLLQVPAHAPVPPQLERPP